MNRLKANFNWRIGIFSSFMCLAVFGFISGIYITRSSLAESKFKSAAASRTAANSGQLVNISTRMFVLNGDNVLIGGFIIAGTAPKQILIRGIGPSLSNFGLVEVLADPTLELHQASNTITTNDNWRTRPDGNSQQAEIQATTIPPTNDLESAILMTLSPGAYTAILAGKNGGVGVGLVEVYDLTAEANSKLVNISTRGFVDDGDNVMIGGLIVEGGGGSATVLIRAIGPSLQSFGVFNALKDPMLELHDGNGVIVASNDRWRDSQPSAIATTGIPPAFDEEAAILSGLAPGSYTAIVRGKNGATGVALVEAYNVNLPLGSYPLPVRGVFTQVIERPGWSSGYYTGDVIQNFNNFDSVVGSTTGQEVSRQLDKMRAMGINAITYELRTSDPTYDPGPFSPPACNIPPVLGFQWPQPTTTELTNLVAFFDLAHSKGIRIFLSLTNTHMEEQPPSNSQTWLGAILGTIKDHPALSLVVFNGDQHVHHRNPDTCGIPAEAPLWLGKTSYAGQYVKWAINFGLELGMPSKKLSAEAIVGDYFTMSQPPAGPEATDRHLWSPIVVLKQIFDDLNIPNNERTYALSFYSHRKCSGVSGIQCTDTNPHDWADQTLQHVLATVGTNNGARIVAVEMGLGDAPTSTWTSERALEDLYGLMGKYSVDGGSYWKWVAQDNQEDADTTKADPVKKRNTGTNFVYNPVQKEILDNGGFHLAILNGSFEIGTSVPYSWTINGMGAGGRYFLAGEAGQPEVPSRGQYDLRLITGPGTNDTISATSDVIAVMPNVSYTATANLRFRWTDDPSPSAAPQLRPQVFVTIHYYDSQGGSSSIRAADVFRFFQENSTNGFATFPLQYTTPNDAASVNIEIGAARNGLPTAITLDADNIR